jgi:hypothetical protein
MCYVFVYVRCYPGTYTVWLYYIIMRMLIRVLARAVLQPNITIR